MKIKSLLEKFNLKMQLSKPIMNLEIEDDQFKKTKERMILPVKKGQDLEYADFNCIIFYSDKQRVILAPDNPFCTITYSKKINEFSTYLYSLSYDGKMARRS